MPAREFAVLLETAVSEVLESMCFLSPVGEAADIAESTPESPWITSTLEFHGSPSGSFGIAASAQTARLIAANFLGEDELSIGEIEAAQVLCEITNMVCGTLLSTKEARQAFDLTSPIWEIGGRREVRCQSHSWRTFALDEGYLQAWVEIKS